MRKAVQGSQRVSLKFLAVISFKFTYVCLGFVSEGTCSAGFLAATLQKVESVK